MILDAGSNFNNQITPDMGFGGVPPATQTLTPDPTSQTTNTALPSDNWSDLPGNAAKEVGNMASGLTDLATFGPIRRQISGQQSIGDFLGSGLREMGQNLVNLNSQAKITGGLTNWLGSLAGISPTATPKQEFISHPIGSVTDVALPLSVAGAGLKLGAKASEVAGAASTASKLSRGAQALNESSNTLNPLTWAAKGVGATVGNIPLGKLGPFEGSTVGDLFSRFKNIGQGVQTPLTQFQNTSRLNEETLPGFAKGKLGDYKGLTEEEQRNLQTNLTTTPNKIPDQQGLFESSGGSLAKGMSDAAKNAFLSLKGYYDNAAQELGSRGVLDNFRDNYSKRTYQEFYPKSDANPFGYTGKPTPANDKFNSFLSNHPEYQAVAKQGLQKSTSISDEGYLRLLNDSGFADKVGLHPIIDPGKLQTIYEAERRSALNLADLVDNLKQTAQTSDRTTEVSDLPQLGGVKFTPKEAQIVADTVKAFGDPNGWADVPFKIVDAINTGGKWAMFGSPLSFGFHVGNLTTLIHAAGVSPFNPANWPKFVDAWRSVGSKDENFLEATKNGAFGTVKGGASASKVTQFAADVWDQAAKESSGTGRAVEFLKNQIPTLNNIRGANTISQNFLWKVDETYRLGLYNALKGTGLDEATAGKMTNHFMVDYNNLTPFERTWMQRIFFFYPWMKGSLPPLAESLTRNPIGNQVLYHESSTQPESLRQRGEAEEYPGGPGLALGSPLKAAKETLTNPGSFLMSRTSPLGHLVPPAFGKYIDTSAPGLLPVQRNLPTSEQQVFPGLYTDPFKAAVVGSIMPSLRSFSEIPNMTPLEQALAAGGFYLGKSATDQETADAKRSALSTKDQATNTRSKAKATAGFKETPVPGLYSK